MDPVPSLRTAETAVKLEKDTSTAITVGGCALFLGGIASSFYSSLPTEAKIAGLAFSLAAIARGFSGVSLAIEVEDYLKYPWAEFASQLNGDIQRLKPFSSYDTNALGSRVECLLNEQQRVCDAILTHDWSRWTLNFLSMWGFARQCTRVNSIRNSLAQDVSLLEAIAGDYKSVEDYVAALSADLRNRYSHIPSDQFPYMGQLAEESDSALRAHHLYTTLDSYLQGCGEKSSVCSFSAHVS